MGAGGAPASSSTTPSEGNMAGMPPSVDAAAPSSMPVASGPDGGDAAAGCAPFVMPDDCTIPENAVLPAELRCTGLYDDWATRTLACGVRTYAPAYALWSDGADKTRYVYLPPATQIDVTNPDDFRYPVGTQFWKEFYVPDGAGTRLGETRLMRKVTAGWLYTSYVWNEDGSNALQENEGVTDLLGTGHTVPARQQCKECHSGRPDFILGWDGLMLGAGAIGITRDDLLNEGLLTWSGKDAGEPNPLELEIPGDDVERAALGYLHANCGVSCHNDSSKALALETGFFTRLDHTTLESVQDTPVMVTGFQRLPSPNAPLSELEPPANGGDYVDLLPLDTERSLVLVRMQIRDNDAAMPRMGTNRVDDAGVALVREWIEQMTPERGYPAP